MKFILINYSYSPPDIGLKSKLFINEFQLEFSVVDMKIYDDYDIIAFYYIQHSVYIGDLTRITTPFNFEAIL